jgi:predicted dehydrogenase
MKTKLALLGCGDVAHRDYLPEFHRIADKAEIVAVCGRGRERAEFTAGKHNIAQVYTDYAQMLAETDAEAIVNLTPMQLHYETNLACLQAGKHVYTEKTAATNNAQARHLQREAATRNLTLVCAPCDMVWPQILLAKELLTQQAIGDVHSARGIGQGGVPPWAGFPSDPSPFFAMGGGPQRDMGVYPLHALTGLLGPVRQVKAMSAKAQTGFTIGDGPFAGKRVPMEEDDTWLILLDHGNGVISSVEANNSVQGSKAPQLELFGLKGTIALNIIDCAAPIDLLQTDKGWDWQSVPVPHKRAGGPDHILGVQHLVECLQTGKAPVLSIAHAAHVIEILDAAAVSSATGNTVSINSRF